jgi:3-oxoacyl-[acyl-carrier protein] reductase
MLLQGKTAIVTGAGRGIGRAVALALAQCGAHVVVVDINPENAHRVAEEICAGGGSAVAVLADVTDRLQVDGIVATATQVFGRVDILVNNAGIVLKSSLLETSLDEWERLMAVNVRSVFLCCKAVFPAMMAQRSGKIVNIASVAGKRGGGIMGNSSYAASKGAVIAFTKGIAREGAPHGINVNAVTPGFTDTEMTRGLDREKTEAIMKSVPLGRAAQPEDIAKAVCFLVSDNAAFITGEIMDVDGGLMMD